MTDQSDDLDAVEIDRGTADTDEWSAAPSQFTCPECHGSLFERQDGTIVALQVPHRSRVQSGHAGGSTIEGRRGRALDRLAGARRERGAAAQTGEPCPRARPGPLAPSASHPKRATSRFAPGSSVTRCCPGSRKSCSAGATTRIEDLSYPERMQQNKMTAGMQTLDFAPRRRAIRPDTRVRRAPRVLEAKPWLRFYRV